MGAIQSTDNNNPSSSSSSPNSSAPSSSSTSAHSHKDRSCTLVLSPAAIPNDYELVIKASKELEYILEEYFGCSGKGLHEKLNSCKEGTIPIELMKKIRFLATIRNKLLHDRNMNAIPDRQAFMDTFEQAKQQLIVIIRQKEAEKNKNNNNQNYNCNIM